MSLNIPYCRKVVEFIEGNHEDFLHYQTSFYEDDRQPGFATKARLVHHQPLCKTTACLAGTAVMLSGDYTIKTVGGVYHPFKTDEMDKRHPQVGWRDWITEAMKLMGLTSEQAVALFYEENETEAVNRLKRYIAQAEKQEEAPACG